MIVNARKIGGTNVKKWIIIIVLFGAIGWVITDFILSNNSKEAESVVDSETETGLEEGMLAPDFELKTANGETVRLSDLRGEKVLLNFWATWCPPCRAEMPDMQKFHEEHDEGVILAVNLTATEQDLGLVEDFLEEFGITFEILYDESTEVSGLYNAFALPTSYLINSDGTIIMMAIGAINYDFLVDKFKEMD